VEKVTKSMYLDFVADLQLPEDTWRLLVIAWSEELRHLPHLLDDHILRLLPKAIHAFYTIEHIHKLDALLCLIPVQLLAL
jgi:hypothetical protein